MAKAGTCHGRTQFDGDGPTAARERMMKRTAILTLGLLSFGVSQSSGQESGNLRDTVAYTTASLRLRERPTAQAPIRTTLPRGTPVRTATCNDGWCTVRARGHTGFVAERFLSLQKPGVAYRPAEESTLPPAPLTLPDYRVLDRVNQMVGGVFGDVLIPSLRPGELTAQTAFAIVKREGMSEAAFYRTRAAQRANYSASYSSSHPGALESGYLGSWKNNRFEPPPSASRNR